MKTFALLIILTSCGTNIDAPQIKTDSSLPTPKEFCGDGICQLYRDENLWCEMDCGLGEFEEPDVSKKYYSKEDYLPGYIDPRPIY